MTEPFMGQIQTFAFNFAPKNWAFCDGQLMSISQNTALFSLLGTTFGGDGQSTFALPDLRGRSPIHPGQAPGLSYINYGEVGGAETVTLLSTNIPAHNHILRSSNTAGTTVATNGASLSLGPSSGSGPNASVLKSYGATAPSIDLHPQTVGITGANSPFGIRSPYLGIYHSIALYGVFPSRN